MPPPELVSDAIAIMDFRLGGGAGGAVSNIRPEGGAASVIAEVPKAIVRSIHAAKTGRPRKSPTYRCHDSTSGLLLSWRTLNGWPAVVQCNKPVRLGLPKTTGYSLRYSPAPQNTIS